MADTPAHKLKALLTQKRGYEHELAGTAHFSNSHPKVKKLKKAIRNTEKHISALRRAVKPIITEHAILRYIERGMGVDLDKVEEAIRGDAARQEVMAAASNEDVAIGGDLYARCVSGSVVSVVYKHPTEV